MAGAVAVGVESTIVGMLRREPMLLRPGGLPRAEIERVLGRALAQPPEDAEERQRTTAGTGHAGLALRAACTQSAAQCDSGSNPARHCLRLASEQFRELTKLPQC